MARSNRVRENAEHQVQIVEPEVVAETPELPAEELQAPEAAATAEAPEAEEMAGGDAEVAQDGGAEDADAAEESQAQEAVADPAAPPDDPRSLLLPIVGEIVHYRLSNGRVRPAIVLHAYDSETVDLSVFTGGEDDRSAIPERAVTVNVLTGADRHGVPPVVLRRMVRRGDGPERWSYLG